MPIDTRRFVRCLTASGFTEQQAETPADGHVALLNGNPAAFKAGLPEWLVCGAPIVQGDLIVTPVKLLKRRAGRRECGRRVDLLNRIRAWRPVARRVSSSGRRPAASQTTAGPCRPRQRQLRGGRRVRATRHHQDDKRNSTGLTTISAWIGGRSSSAHTWNAPSRTLAAATQGAQACLWNRGGSPTCDTDRRPIRAWDIASTAHSAPAGGLGSNTRSREPLDDRLPEDRRA